MSQVITQTGGVLMVNTDTRKLLIGDNMTATGNNANATGSAVTILSGTLMGRVRSTNKIVPCLSTATNGSQIPIGVLLNDSVIPANSNLDLVYVTSGEVDASMFVFSNGTDTLDTQLLFSNSSDAATTTSAGSYRDILQGKGFKLSVPVDFSRYANL